MTNNFSWVLSLSRTRLHVQEDVHSHTHDLVCVLWAFSLTIYKQGEMLLEDTLRRI